MSVQEMKEILSQQYPYRIELHAHTNPVSGCSELSPETLVRNYAEKGFHGIVITNHFSRYFLDRSGKDAIKIYLEDYNRAKLAGESYGIAVYLGAELLFADSRNDYLLYGADADVLEQCSPYLHGTVTQFRQEVSLPDSVFLQAHPMRDDMVLCNPAILDGMECVNIHPHHNGRIGPATRYAYERDLAIKIAGSDCHHLGHEGLCGLRSKTLPTDSFGVAQILKSGDYLFEISNSLWIP